MQSVYLNTRPVNYYNQEKELVDRDKKYVAYKHFKVGIKPSLEDMFFQTEKLKALCSGYCQVDEFTDKVLEFGRGECKEAKEDKGKSYGDERIRYKRCVIERSKYKTKEYEMW